MIPPCQRCDNAQEEIRDLRQMISRLREDLREARALVSTFPDPEVRPLPLQDLPD